MNTLTVVANEGYEQFAENLQKEIEADTGIRFGIVEKHQFASIPVTDEAGRPRRLGWQKSEAIWVHLRGAGHVDVKGKVQDTLRQALKDGRFMLARAVPGSAPAGQGGAPEAGREAGHQECR